MTGRDVCMGRGGGGVGSGVIGKYSSSGNIGRCFVTSVGSQNSVYDLITYRHAHSSRTRANPL